MTRPFEVCGALEDGFRICERLLLDGEPCPEHGNAPVIVEECECDVEWLICREEIWAK